MTRRLAAISVLLIALAPLSVQAGGGRHSGRGAPSWSSASHGGHQGPDNRSYRLPWWAGRSGYWTYGPGALERRARRQRSAAAKAAFRRGHPCPATGQTGGACPGYVIDHVIALKRGGPDSPDNMQWQTVEAAKAKDRVE
jgi:hypothetical protein